MSEDFGSYLKHERELRGIPLEDIALSTKVSLRFLQALEENRFDDLPGDVFIKGFIRSYGQAIGSNIDELLATYYESSGQRPKVEVSSEEGAGETKSRGTDNSLLKMALGMGTALAVILGGVYWATTTRDSTPEEETQETAPGLVDSGLSEAATASESALPAEHPIPGSGSPASGSESASMPLVPPSAEVPAGQTPQATGQPQAPTKNTVTVSEKGDIIKHLQDQVVSQSDDPSVQTAMVDQSLRLVIWVSENSWFNLTVDDQRDQDFILPGGGSKTIEAKAAIVMTIGNRRATQLTLNNQSLELPESPDNVIRNFTVNAERLN